jgi:cytochrome c oxidase subunit 3/cytochrome o ubiquinol oxidase subunit 3
MLLSLVGLSTAGKLNRPTDARKVELIGLYWHFVDIVWIVIFTVIYLIPH